MSIAAGVLSQAAVTSTTVTVSSTAASGGSGPYTQQLYMSTDPSFSPGGGNIIAGATALVNQVTGLIPNTTYYFKMVYTDTGHSNDQATSSALTSVTSPASLNQNQFAQAPYIATLDQSFNYNTRSVEIDPSQSGLLYAGQAVKVVVSSQGPGGVPKVVACTAATDEVYGFIVFNFKDVSYAPGAFCEISQVGNVQYLYATAAVNAGAELAVDLSTVGGVKTVDSTQNVVGNAIDTATAPGQLIRVNVSCPSYKFAA